MVTLDAREVGTGSEGRSTRRYTSDDMQWATAAFARAGGRLRFRRGSVIDAATLPGIVALHDGAPVGLFTVIAHTGEVEIAALGVTPGDDSTMAQLLSAAIASVGAECRRLFTVCTNAELDLHRTLQQHGFRLVAVRPGAITAARPHIPPGQIPTVIGGVPVTDEIEFEFLVR